MDIPCYRQKYRDHLAGDRHQLSGEVCGIGILNPFLDGRCGDFPDGYPLRADRGGYYRRRGEYGIRFHKSRVVLVSAGECGDRAFSGIFLSQGEEERFFPGDCGGGPFRPGRGGLVNAFKYDLLSGIHGECLGRRVDRYAVAGYQCEDRMQLFGRGLCGYAG